MSVLNDYDVIVVGAGHAGCEAALACARMGAKTLISTIRKDKIAQMSCNPSIGGLAKGQLVKEIDALGGEMGLIADETAIQFRQLNTKKGPAVRSSRIQSDKGLYRKAMTRVVLSTENLEVFESEARSLIVENDEVKGVVTTNGEKIRSKAVIIATGTFLNGVIHIGDEMIASGRDFEPPSEYLSLDLRRLGFKIGRLKTGTVPRLLKDSVEFDGLEIQEGDKKPGKFSFWSEGIKLPQVPCYLTYTNEKTHAIVRENLQKSALYSGQIKGRGARYCPSLEDKIVKFPDHERHQIFLEPEGLESSWIYPNGISNSLPRDIQVDMVHSIKGLERAEIVQPGYGIEYDFVDPTCLYPWLETKKISNLFFAGQINGTSGYEEAAAQGLIAGINAVLKLRGESPYIVDRSKGYIGVLIDDLVTKGTDEPYRMFTSRAEYRLVLREDNADRRLCEDGFKLGLLKKDRYEKFRNKLDKIEELKSKLTRHELNPTPEVNKLFEQLNIPPMKNRFNLLDLLKRPNIGMSHLGIFIDWLNEYSEEVKEQVEIDIKYEGYIKRQNEEIEQFKKREDIKLPVNIDYFKIKSLTREVQEKLSKIKPVSLGQAARISGITPAAISVLMIHIKK